VALVRERTIPTERPPPVGEVSANFNYVKYKMIYKNGGPGSVVGIETAYGLGGPGIESRWGRDFPHQSLRPIQPPVQWVPGLSRG